MLGLSRQLLRYRGVGGVLNSFPKEQGDATRKL